MIMVIIGLLGLIMILVSVDMIVVIRCLEVGSLLIFTQEGGS